MTLIDHDGGPLRVYELRRTLASALRFEPRLARWHCWGDGLGNASGTRLGSRHANTSLSRCEKAAAAALRLPDPQPATWETAPLALRRSLSSKGQRQLDRLVASTTPDPSGTVTVAFAAYPHTHLLLNWLVATNRTFLGRGLASVVVVCGDARLAGLLATADAQGPRHFYDADPVFARPAPNRFTSRRMGMMQHAELMRAAVASGFLAHGVHVLLSDVDAVPTRNDERLFGPGAVAVSTASDVVSSPALFPAEAVNAWGVAVCCGWLWLRGGAPRVLSLLQRTFDLFFQLKPKDGQIAMNRILVGDGAIWFVPPNARSRTGAISGGGDLFGWAVFQRTGLRMAMLSACVVNRAPCGGKGMPMGRLPIAPGCAGASVIHCRMGNGAKSKALREGGVWHLGPRALADKWDELDRKSTAKAPKCAAVFDLKCHLPDALVVPLPASAGLTGLLDSLTRS